MAREQSTESSRLLVRYFFLFIKLLSSSECALLALYKNKERQRDEKSFSCGKKKKEYKKFWTKVGLGRRNETM